MVVFAAPDAWLGVWVCFRETSDVDKETVSYIDPSCIDDVHAVAAHALPDPRIYVEEVCAFYLLIVGDVGIVGLVVGFAEVV